MMEHWLNMVPNASAHGAAIDHLIGLLHWLMFALFIGWGIFFVYTLIRFRKKNNPKADYYGAKTHISSYLEVGVALIEAILLIGFSIPMWARAVAQLPDEKDAIVVKVVAEQFAWNFHYAGPDGKFGRTDPKFVDTVSNPLGIDPSDENGKDDIHSINQLFVPVDKPVIVKISSKDVIHSFGVPALRVKQDAIPGMEVPAWFTGIKTGQYEIACSQLCGIGHYSMHGYVQIKTQDEYASWITAQAAEKLKHNTGGGGDSFWN